MAILGWFLTPRGALVAAFGVMFVAWQFDRTAVAWRSKKQGAAELVTVSKEAGAKANAKNEKVRADAKRPGAADRLLNDKATCRDC